MKNPGIGSTITNSGWNSLIKAGGIAALVAGLLFRRNLGVEISLFSAQKQPGTVTDWFMLLQENRILGLSYLHLFDLVNYFLVGLMLLALYVVLRRVNQSFMAMALALGFVGIAVYFASNTAFSMLSLSEQYATATAEAQRTMLLSAGEALLAINRFTSPGAHPGSGGLTSLFLIAAAGLLVSLVMLRSGLFHRAIAYVGIGASSLDLAYCFAFVFLPALDGHLVSICFIPAAGLLLMLWHILIGIMLCRLGRSLEMEKP